MNYFLNSETRLNLIEKLEETGMPTKMAVGLSEYPDDLDKLDIHLTDHSNSARHWAERLVNSRGNVDIISECRTFITADVIIMDTYKEEAIRRKIPETRFRKWREANRSNTQRCLELHEQIKAITRH